MPVERAILTVEELSTMLGISPDLVYELVRTNQVPVPVIRLGRKIRFPRAAVESYLRMEQTLEAPAAERRDESRYYREVLETVLDLCRRALDRGQVDAHANAP